MNVQWIFLKSGWCWFSHARTIDATVQSLHSPHLRHRATHRKRMLMKLFAASIAVTTTLLIAGTAFAQQAQNAQQQPTTVNQMIEQQQAKPAFPAPETD